MIRFRDIDIKAIKEIPKDSDCLKMNHNIWEDGRTYFKYHRNAEKVPVIAENDDFICYAFQDTEANRELRMLQELCDTQGALHFENIYPEYSCVVIQECNELAYYFAKYLQSRGIQIKVVGKYWNKVDVWSDEDIIAGDVLTIYAEGTWKHNTDIAYERMRSVSVEFEYIENIFKENIRQGMITNKKCSYREWLKELRGKEIILIGTGNRMQDIYNMLAEEGGGVNIAAFLTDGTGNGLRILGKEVIGTEDIEKYENPIFIEWGKGSALGSGHLDEYVYYGCKRNLDYFFFQDYADIQKNSLWSVLKNRKLVLVGDEQLACHMKKYLLSRGKEDSTMQYYETLESDFNGQDVIALILTLQFFGGSIEKWREEIEKQIHSLKEHHIVDHTLYFTMTNSFIHMELNDGKKYNIEELRPKGVLIGAIGAFSGNIFCRDCIDDHPNMIQFGYHPVENDMFSYCIRLAQLSVDQIVSGLFAICKRVIGEEDLPFFFPDIPVFVEKCNAVLNGRKTVTSQELFVLFAIAYNEMMGRKVPDITQTYIYWEPHMNDIPLKLLYTNWLADEQVKMYCLYVTRNSLIATGSALKYTYGTEQKLGMMQMFYMLLHEPYILDENEGAYEKIILKFEELKLFPRETWKKLCDKMEIPWSDTFLETTRFGEKSYFDNGAGKISGYDLEPVYRDYADLFSPFDKVRICFCKLAYQRKYGYPYDDIAFTRKELQEMYIKDFKCRKIFEVSAEEGDDEYFQAHKYIQRRLNEMYVKLFWESLAGDVN